jgi:hypothetical protein
VDLASQGQTVEEAPANLRDALELHFGPPVASHPPTARQIEVEVAAAFAFPEMKRRLESAGFKMSARREVMSSSRAWSASEQIRRSCRGGMKFRSPHIGPEQWEKL